jgi:hypothetical protein
MFVRKFSAFLCVFLLQFKVFRTVFGELAFVFIDQLFDLILMCLGLIVDRAVMTGLKPR